MIQALNGQSVSQENRLRYFRVAEARVSAYPSCTADLPESARMGLSIIFTWRRAIPTVVAAAPTGVSASYMGPTQARIMAFANA